MSPQDRLVRDSRVIVAYADGARTKDIAELVGITSRSVHNIVKRAGIARPRGRPCAITYANDHQMEQYRRYRRHYGADMAKQMVEGLQ